MRYRVKELRKKRGWSQDSLARLAGTSKGFISQIETGAREPSAETLRSLAAALEVSAAELIAADSDDAQEIMDHLEIFQALSAEDRAMVARIAAKLAQPDPVD